MIDPSTVATAIETAEALRTQNGQSIETATWLTAGGVITGLISVLGIWITQRGGWISTAQAARNEDFRRLREEIARHDGEMKDVKDTLAAMQERVDRAERTAGDMQLKMVHLQTAFELVSGELARHDPENKILKQARDLIARAATSDEEVFSAAIATLSKGRGR